MFSAVSGTWLRQVFTVSALIGLFIPSSLVAQSAQLSHQQRFESQAAMLAQSDEKLTKALETNANDVEALQQRSLVRLQQGRVADAVADVRRVIQIAPANSSAHSQLAAALFDEGKRDEAMVEARRAIEMDAHNFAAEALLGRLLAVTGGDLKEAIAHMMRSLDINADQPDLRFDLVNALRETKDYVAAGVQVRLLGVSLPPGDPRLEYAQASLYLDLNHPEAAILHLRRALKSNPDFVPARQDLSASLIQLGRWQEASEVLGPLVEQQPESARLAYMDALVLENTRHPQAAEAEAHRALTLNPQYADAFTILGVSQAVQGRHADAIKSLEQAIALRPESFDAQFHLGRERYAINDAAGAAHALDAAIAIRPEDAEARFLLGTALESSGDKDAAMAQYSELARLHPDDPRGHIGLGSILLRYGKTDQALTELTKARQLDPRNFETAMNIGKVLAREGKLDESIRYLSEASREAPASPEAHYQLAISLRRAGRNAEAAREFAEVERLNEARRGVAPN